MRLSIDFETRSVVNIKKAGAWRYATDPTTDVLCLAFKADNNEPKIWIPEWILTAVTTGLQKSCLVYKREWQDFVATHCITKEEAELLIEEADKITAFNAGFEVAIWTNQLELVHGFKKLPLEKISCTAARSAILSLPRSLDKVAEALKLSHKKDKNGSYIMRKLSRPRKPTGRELIPYKEKGYEFANDLPIDPQFRTPIPFWHDPENYAEDFVILFKYCEQDVNVEAELDDVLPPLSEDQFKIWTLDQEINRRGVHVDEKLVRSALDYIAYNEHRLSDKLITLTDGAVQTAKQTAKMLDWVNDHGGQLANLQKATVHKALHEETTPPLVRDVLELRVELGKSSTSKYKTLLASRGFDGRIRDLFRFHGASTGRWAGKGIQVHNLPRGSFTDYDAAIECLLRGDYGLLEWLYDAPPLEIASTLIRPTLTAAAGKDLICSDFASIEGRVLAWTAGEDEVLEHYRQGRDMYLIAASTIYGGNYDALHAEYKAGNKTKRTVGKPTELGLGYGGGIGAFASMAAVYNVDCETLPSIVFPLATAQEKERGENTARAYLKNRRKNQTSAYEHVMSFDAATACDIIKQKWRAVRSKTVARWSQMEHAAITAVEYRGEFVEAGRTTFFCDDNYLQMLLPSGRALYYFKPEIQESTTPWGKKVPRLHYQGSNDKGQWGLIATYGGRLVENETQAIACDLLINSMLLLEEARYPIVLHVHDEIVCEVPKGEGSIKEFEMLMGSAPWWAQGLPLKAAGGWRGHRYRKD